MYIEFTKVDKKTYAYESTGFDNVLFISCHGDSVNFKIDGEKDWHEYRNGRDFDFMSVM